MHDSRLSLRTYTLLPVQYAASLSTRMAWQCQNFLHTRMYMQQMLRKMTHVRKYRRRHKQNVRRTVAHFLYASCTNLLYYFHVRRLDETEGGIRYNWSDRWMSFAPRVDHRHPAYVSPISPTRRTYSSYTGRECLTLVVGIYTVSHNIEHFLSQFTSSTVKSPQISKKQS